MGRWFHWLLIGIVVAAVLVWVRLIFGWRSAMLDAVASGQLSDDERLSHRTAIDSEFAKALTGVVVALGLLVTVSQAINAMQAADSATVTARLKDGYQLLSGEAGDERSGVGMAGGVYTLASVAEVDERFAPRIYESLYAFARAQWPARCPRSDEACDSERLDVSAQAVLNVLRGAGPAAAGKVDLSGVNLSQGNLSGLALREALLERADLSGAKLHGALLQQADFFRTNLFNAELYGVRADGARFLEALLAHGLAAAQPSEKPAVFRGARFDEADLHAAKLCRASFRDANLFAAELDGVVAYQVDFSDAKLARASFAHAELSGALFAGAKTESSGPFDLTCARLAKREVPSGDYCRGNAQGIAVPAAVLPAEIADHAILCMTEMPDGTTSCRDCPDPVHRPSCCWEIPACRKRLLGAEPGDYRAFLGGEPGRPAAECRT